MAIESHDEQVHTGRSGADYPQKQPPGEIVSTIGSRIKKAREAARLSQQEVATHMGLSRNSVAQWEIGANSPAQRRLPELATFLGVSVQWLMLGESDAAAKSKPDLDDSSAKQEKINDLVRTIRTLVLELDDITRS